MISIISMNAFSVVLCTDYETRYKMFRLFEILEMIFVTAYNAEFYLKVYVDPIDYWKDGYNLLDVVIIITLSIPYFLRKVKGKHYPYLNIADGIQSLRILKLITYSRGIRKNVDYRSFTELVENFKKTLQHTDPMVLDDFGTSLPFIDVYLSTLDNQDTTIYKLQELYYEIVHVLNLMLEDLPQKKRSYSSEKVDDA